MSEYTMSKARSIVVVNHSQLSLELSLKFNKMPRDRQREFFAGDHASGFFYLYVDSVIAPDTVMECVVSKHGDAITSLYKVNPIFASVGELVKMRNELVRAIAEKVGLSVGAVGIDDPGRGRTLGLDELSTGQMVDLLAERMGQSIITTDSHVVGGQAIEPGVLTMQADGSLKVA